MAAADKVAHTQQLAKAHAAPLVCLSRLSYLMFDHVESWTLGFVDSLSSQIRSGDLQAARALLHPLVDRGDALTDNDLRSLGLMFACFPGARPILSLHDSDSGLDACVVVSGSATVVIFGGTETTKDVFADQSFSQASFGNAGGSAARVRSGVRVHRGFWGTYTSKSSNEILLRLVLRESARHPDREILITGHSLGAALAVLCGMELSKRTEREVNVVAFACPRVGNRGFRTLVQNQTNLNVLRVKLDEDPVTQIPVTGYRHVGVLAWIRGGLVDFLMDEHSHTGAYFARLGCVVAEAVRVREHRIQLYYEAVVRLWPLQRPTEISV